MNKTSLDDVIRCLGKITSQDTNKRVTCEAVWEIIQQQKAHNICFHGYHGTAKKAWASVAVNLLNWFGIIKEKNAPVLELSECIVATLFEKVRYHKLVILHNVCHASAAVRTEMCHIIKMRPDIIYIATGDPRKLRDFFETTDALTQCFEHHVILHPFTSRQISQVVVRLLEVSGSSWTVEGMCCIPENRLKLTKVIQRKVDEYSIAIKKYNNGHLAELIFNRATKRCKRRDSSSYSLVCDDF